MIRLLVSWSPPCVVSSWCCSQLDHRICPRYPTGSRLNGAFTGTLRRELLLPRFPVLDGDLHIKYIAASAVQAAALGGAVVALAGHDTLFLGLARLHHLAHHLADAKAAAEAARVA